MRHFLLFLTLLFVFSPAHAATYYAAASGSDGSANCTEGSPCASVNRIVEQKLTAAGDIGRLRCGDTFYETSGIVAQASGTSGNPIRLEPYGSCYDQRGTHAGSNNSSNLVVPGTNFSSVGVQVGEILHNLDDASHCNVTSITTTSTTNDTLVCERGLAFGRQNDWDTGERYSINNYPIITLASLFNSGWSEVATNVWSHTTTRDAWRHVWINGWSPNSSHHTGTCSASGMASASDRQWCATDTAVYIRSTSNPASRWTAPGVEVVHLFTNAAVLFSLGSRSNWTITNINMQRTLGEVFTASGGSNITIQGGNYGWSQRHNCADDCWNGNSYSWLTGDDNRDGGGIQFGCSGTCSNINVTDVLIHNTDNNGSHLGGTGIFNGVTYRNVELINSYHGGVNLASSGSSAGQRNNVLFDRVIFHDSCTSFHTGGEGVTFNNLIVRNSVWRDGIFAGDTRIFAPAEGCGTSGSSGFFMENPGTFLIERSIITGFVTGVRINRGNLTIDQSTITDNEEAGVSANNTAKVTLTNNIITNNGTGGPNASSYEVGCEFTPCTATDMFAGDNNKFGRASFGYVVGRDTSATLADWQGLFVGANDVNSVTTADCFVDSGNRDWNLAPGCDDTGALRGPFREVTLASGIITGTLLVLDWSAGSSLPISSCSVSLADVRYNGVNATETSCTPGIPASNQTTLVMASSPGADPVTVAGAYGMVEDGSRLGGIYNAKSRAFTATAVTNAGGPPSPSTGFVYGSTVTITPDTDQILVTMGCWEKNAPTASPIDFTSCTYGGQSMTKVGDANISDPSLPSEVLATMWYLNDAGITAASSDQLVCVTDEAEAAGRPKILVSTVLSGINQTSPMLDFQVASHMTDSTITTPALATSGNPGVALFLACAGNNGSWEPGSGWEEGADEAEDGDPGTRLHAASRATAGDTPTGSATFTTSQSFSNRTTAIVAAFDGGEEVAPPANPVYTQTHVAAYRHGQAEGVGRFCPLDGVCELAPGRKFTGRAQVEVEGALSPSLAYEWWCSDNGGAYYHVSTESSGWVSLATSDRNPTTTLSNQLALDGDAFVACGTQYNAGTVAPTTCSTTAVSQRFEFELSAQLSASAVVGQGVVCRLRQAGSVVLDSYTESIELTVTGQQAAGM